MVSPRFLSTLPPEFEPVIRKPWTFLFDLNLTLLTLCLNWLQCKTPVSLTEWYEPKADSGLFDARSRVNAQNRTDGYRFYRPVPYPQNFGVEFVPNSEHIRPALLPGTSRKAVLDRLI